MKTLLFFSLVTFLLAFSGVNAASKIGDGKVSTLATTENANVLLIHPCPLALPACLDGVRVVSGYSKGFPVYKCEYFHNPYSLLQRSNKLEINTDVSAVSFVSAGTVGSISLLCPEYRCCPWYSNWIFGTCHIMPALVY
jgi:hypothetical protein